MMMHMVFKVAKTMAPSVIYIDEVEKVFCTDKKKMKVPYPALCVGTCTCALQQGKRGRGRGDLRGFVL